MRLLVDTHILIWMLMDDSRLNSKARQTIAGATGILVSSASIWEIAIKVRVGKLRIDLARLISRMALTGIDELTVTNTHALATAQLPMLHRDPFDRMLVAQAMTESAELLTADVRLAPYSDLVVLV